MAKRHRADSTIGDMMLEKHIDIVQSIIARMSGNCFIIKGWCITLVAGLCAISVAKDRNVVYLLAYIPTVLFGLLDAYYLWLERSYRALYDDVINSHVTKAFSMNIEPYKTKRRGYFGAYCSITVAPFYIGLAATILLVGLCIK